MVLHPDAVAFLDAGDDGEPGPGDRGFDLAAARRDTSSSPPARLGRDDDVAHVVDLDAGGVPCRLYRPSPGAPVLVFLHGGGWVVGDLDSHDAVCRLLAARSGAAVLAVGYRLAPEHPFPAALEDAETAVRWLRDHAAELYLVANRVAVVGDSAGGNLAAGLVRRARDRDGGDSPYVLQALVYPCLDPRLQTPSAATESGGLTAAEMRWYWDVYAPADPPHPDAAPGLADDLAGLPAALVLSAEHDPLRDEAEDYAARLAAAGVPVVAVRSLGMVHGFWRRPAVFAASETAVDLVAAEVRRALDRRPHP